MIAETPYEPLTIHQSRIKTYTTEAAMVCTDGSKRDNGCGAGLIIRVLVTLPPSHPTHFGGLRHDSMINLFHTPLNIAFCVDTQAVLKAL